MELIRSMAAQLRFRCADFNLSYYIVLLYFMDCIFACAVLSQKVPNTNVV